GTWCWTWWCCREATGTTRTRTSSRVPSAPATSPPRRPSGSGRRVGRRRSTSPTGGTRSPPATSTSSRIRPGRCRRCPRTTPGIWTSRDGERVRSPLRRHLAQGALGDGVHEAAYPIGQRQLRRGGDPAQRLAHVRGRVREGLRGPGRPDPGVLLDLRPEVVV